MSDRTWCLIDVSHLAYRNQFVMRDLSYRGKPTGAIYGILRDILTLDRQYNHPYFVFAFDSKRNKRRDEFPWYKGNRTVDEDIRRAVREQTKRLRSPILPQLGLLNILKQSGYEADDLIAQAAYNLAKCPQDSVVIVSGDRDLFQCLRANVSQLLKKGTMTLQQFKKTYYGLAPHNWKTVKAIAGCETDNIKGVFGVGEVTAAKWYRGVLNDGPLKDKIEEFVKTEEFEINLRLVSLPLKGTKSQLLEEDEVGGDWTPVLKSLGIESLEPEVTGDTSLRRGIKRHG